MSNNYPKLHNAMWPGLVGKGPDAEEPAIDLDTMLDLTAAAEVDGQKFEGLEEAKAAWGVAAAPLALRPDPTNPPPAKL